MRSIPFFAEKTQFKEDFLHTKVIKNVTVTIESLPIASVRLLVNSTISSSKHFFRCYWNKRVKENFNFRSKTQLTMYRIVSGGEFMLLDSKLPKLSDFYFLEIGLHHVFNEYWYNLTCSFKWETKQPNFDSPSKCLGESREIISALWKEWSKFHFLKTDKRHFWQQRR